MAAPEEETSGGGVGGEERARLLETSSKPAARRADERARCSAWASGRSSSCGRVGRLRAYTTSNPRLCKSCHWPAAGHAKAEKGSDPHAEVACVSCHEPGGVCRAVCHRCPVRGCCTLATRYGGGGRRGGVRASRDRACKSCHAVAGRDDDEHRARAEDVARRTAGGVGHCTDCHTMSGGVVGAYNAGMKPCLRCHDGNRLRRSASTCHTRSAAAAARARTTTFQAAQIDEISCGGCHDEKRDCDPCHGMRMPHTDAFMAGRTREPRRSTSGTTTARRVVGVTPHRVSPCTGATRALIGKAHGRILMARTHQTRRFVGLQHLPPHSTRPSRRATSARTSATRRRRSREPPLTPLVRTARGPVARTFAAVDYNPRMFRDAPHLSWSLRTT